MSEENIDADHLTPRDQEIIARLRRTYDAISRSDFDSAIEIADPDIEFATPGLTARRGADELRAWMEPVTIEVVSFELESFQIVGNNVLVRHHARGRGVASGINVEGYYWVVWTINEDGLATRMVGFSDHKEAKARQAAGLTE